MEQNKVLFADETLDGFSQESLPYSLPPGFELVKFDTSSDSVDADHSISTVKRKREDEIDKLKIEKRHKSKDEFPPPSQCEVEMKNSHKKNQFFKLIDDVIVSESCSLFNSVSLSWKLGLSSINYSTISFTKTNDPELLGKANSKNGIWLHMNFSKKDQLSVGKDIVLLLELYETYLHSEASRDQLVQFCNGKCQQKRNEVIELQELTVTANCKGYFEASVAVNEQCAHRSDNDYGSPRTRFYFLLKCFDKAEVINGQAIPFFVAKSNQLKVVAPGKAAKPQIPKKTKASKLTLQQSMETIIRGLEKFDERLSTFESSDTTEKLKQLETRVTNVENYIAQLPSLILQMVEKSVQDAMSKQNLELLTFCSKDLGFNSTSSVVKDLPNVLPSEAALTQSLEDLATSMSPIGFDFSMF